jgi:hypothetical protein
MKAKNYAAARSSLLAKKRFCDQRKPKIMPLLLVPVLAKLELPGTHYILSEHRFSGRP